jgi:hypothetical protein
MQLFKPRRPVESPFARMTLRQRLRIVQIFTVVMMLVVINASVLVVSVVGSAPVPEVEDYAHARQHALRMSLTTLVMTLLSVGAATLLSGRRFSDKWMKKLQANAKLSKSAAMSQRVMMLFIFRLTALNLAAVVGLVVCSTAAKVGVIQNEPIYWLNAVPAGAFLLYCVIHFPTQGRLEEHRRRLEDPVDFFPSECSA